MASFNFLQNFADPAKKRSIPEIENILASLGPQQEQEQGLAPYQAVQAQETIPVEMADPAASFSPTMDLKQSRPRLSALDTFGRIADVFARVGGAEAMYQPSLDAAANKELAEQDRMRSIDMEELRRKQIEQQMQAGGMDIANAEREQIAQALAPFAMGQADPALWGDAAAQAGIAPEKAAAINEILTRNPQAASAIAQSLGWSPPQQGSQAKEIQMMEYLSEKNPEYLKQYMDKMVSAGQMTQAQAAQIQLAQDKFQFDKHKFQNPQATPQMRNASAGIVPAGKGSAKAGGSGMQKAALANLDELSGIYNELNKIGGIVSAKNSALDNIIARGGASGIGQIVEGALGTEAQTLRDRIASIRPSLMQTIAQATGMTGKQLDSNSDVKLFMQTVTDPTSSYEANQKAISGLRRFIQANQSEATPARRPVPGQRQPVPARMGPAALELQRRRGLAQ